MTVSESLSRWLTGGLCLLGMLVVGCSSRDEGQAVACQRLALIDAWSGLPSGKPEGLTEFGGRLYFQVNDGVHGEELWVHEPGVGAGLAFDLVPGSGASVPNHLSVVDGKLYFSANHLLYGRELWVIESSAPDAGPRLVADIHAGRGSSDPGMPVSLHGRLYFVASDGVRGPAVWMYEETAGAVPVTDFRHGVDANYSNLTVAGDSLYFRSHSQDGRSEVWYLDPADGSLEQVTVGSDPTVSSHVFGYIAMGGKLYFTVDDGVHGEELWAHDPVSGSVLVADINPGADDGYPFQMTVLQGKLYFRADHPESGRELWEYDPLSGARLVADLRPGTDGGYTGWRMLVLDDVLYFIADDGVLGERLWQYDPQTANASLVENPAGSSDAPPVPSLMLTASDGRLYFRVALATGYTIWAYEPATGFSLLVDRFADNGLRYGPGSSLAFDNRLYFTMDDGIHGRELWILDRACL